MTSNNKQVTVNHADSDGTEFKLPGDEPGEAPFDLELNDGQHYRWYVHIDNGWDVSADFTLEGSHTFDGATNNTIDTPVPDGAAITISGGERDFFDGTTGHSLIQLNVLPAADPTSGELTVTFQRRKE